MLGTIGHSEWSHFQGRGLENEFSIKLSVRFYIFLGRVRFKFIAQFFLVVTAPIIKLFQKHHLHLSFITFSGVFRHELRDYEALGVANVIYNLTVIFPMSVFLKLPVDIFRLFLHHVAVLTCNFARSAALEEAVRATAIGFMPLKDDFATVVS